MGNSSSSHRHSYKFYATCCINGCKCDKFVSDLRNKISESECESCGHYFHNHSEVQPNYTSSTKTTITVTSNPPRDASHL